MASKIFYIFFITLYSILMMISVIKSKEKKEKEKLIIGNTFIFIGSILMFMSSFATIFKLTFYFIFLLIGLILSHIGALINGFKLYVKPHLKHHLIRTCISLFIIVIYYFANKST